MNKQDLIELILTAFDGNYDIDLTPCEDCKANIEQWIDTFNIKAIPYKPDYIHFCCQSCGNAISIMDEDKRTHIKIGKMPISYLL